MTPLPLLAVACTRTRPAPYGCAAAEFIAVNPQSGQEWLCKGATNEKRKHLPASEWLASQLALTCGLPVPAFAPIEVVTHPGITYFGSLWEYGAIDYTEARKRITNEHSIIQAHALDLFVHNTDRHYRNFLYLQRGQEIQLRVIDFSHSLMVMGWPLPTLPFAPWENTQKCIGQLLRDCRQRHAQPDSIFNTIAGLDDSWMQHQLNRMPTQWVDAETAQKLTYWWASNDRHARIQRAQSCLP